VYLTSHTEATCGVFTFLLGADSLSINVYAFAEAETVEDPAMGGYISLAGAIFPSNIEG